MAAEPGAAAVGERCPGAGCEPRQPRRQQQVPGAPGREGGVRSCRPQGASTEPCRQERGVGIWGKEVGLLLAPSCALWGWGWENLGWGVLVKGLVKRCLGELV